MSGKHTPGPWLVRNGWADDGRLEVYLDRTVKMGKPTEIAEINDCYDENIYNAQLIAAAPDLLEALKRLVLDFESEIHNECDGTSMLESRLAECDYARLAINKAEGKI